MLSNIENSLITKYKNKIYDKFVKAIDDYKLILPNDKVCVCISGGKDSMLMAKLFEEYKKNSIIDFEIKYLVMNPGYNEYNLNIIKNNLKTLNIDAIIKETNIFEIAAMQEKTPCYLCAKMRRGALYRLANDLGCNKIALGHHFDDVIETTLMNMLNSGSFQTMLPKLHSQNYEGMELIRPMYLIKEEDVLDWASYNNLVFIRCACKFTEENYSCENSNSQRLNTKRLIRKLREEIPNLEMNIFKSATNVNLDKVIGFKINKEIHTIKEKEI